MTRVLSVLNGEILKLRKRPAVWICIAILVVILLTMGANVYL